MNTFIISQVTLDRFATSAAMSVARVGRGPAGMAAGAPTATNLTISIEAALASLFGFDIVYSHKTAIENLPREELSEGSLELCAGGIRATNLRSLSA